LRIGVVGYGKMGVLIRNKALSKGYPVPVIVDPFSPAKEVTDRNLPPSARDIDVFIDFSSPEVVLDNIQQYQEMDIPAVIGTTGWYEKMNQVAETVENSSTGLIWSANFSLGVNLFFYLLKTAGRVMNRFPQYDVMIHEYHHRHKAESPSGTAEMIGSILLDVLDHKQKKVTGNPGGKLEESELHISSTRGGSIPGTHQVIFDSDVDTIVFEHTTRDRSGFAEGALLAAEWICGRKGFYCIDDMMHSIIGR